MFTIKEITLLSKEDYIKSKHLFPQFMGWWWLQNPDTSPYNACCVNRSGVVFNFNIRQAIYIRPVLKILGLDAECSVGDKINHFNFKWTIYKIENETAYALCDTYADIRRFDGKTNKWEKSEIKDWLEQWLYNKTRDEREKLKKKK